MDILILAFAAAFCGWLAYRLLSPILSERDSVATAALAGLIGGLLLAPTFGVSDFGELNVAALLVALGTAVVALSVVDLHLRDA